MSESLVIEYAQNRILLKSVNDRISEISYQKNSETGYSVGLSKYRDSFLEVNDGDWFGWVIAVATYEEGGETEDEVELAMLLDEKAKLRRELGVIKRRIYAKGKSLISKKINCQA